MKCTNAFLKLRSGPHAPHAGHGFLLIELMHPTRRSNGRIRRFDRTAERPDLLSCQ